MSLGATGMSVGDMRATSRTVLGPAATAEQIDLLSAQQEQPATRTPSGPTLQRVDNKEVQGMKFTKSGGRSGIGPGDWFTGLVYIDAIRDPDDQSAVGCAHVRFTPGARTAWHTHPKGQTLYVTDGIGYVARRGGETEEIRPGDVVYIEPNEEHWHGATPDRFMAHVAIQEADGRGQVVAWGDQVTDGEYGAHR